MSNETHNRTDACSAQALLTWAAERRAIPYSENDDDAAAVLDLPADVRVALDALHAAAAAHGINVSTTVKLPWPMLGGSPMEPWNDGTARSASLYPGLHSMFICSPALPETGDES